jgi:hypothetical protein
VARQSSAKARTAVRIRSGPPKRDYRNVILLFLQKYGMNNKNYCGFQFLNNHFAERQMDEYVPATIQYFLLKMLWRIGNFRKPASW